MNIKQPNLVSSAFCSIAVNMFPFYFLVRECRWGFIPQHWTTKEMIARTILILLPRYLKWLFSETYLRQISQRLGAHVCNQVLKSRNVHPVKHHLLCSKRHTPGGAQNASSHIHFQCSCQPSRHPCQAEIYFQQPAQ